MAEKWIPRTLPSIFGVSIGTKDKKRLTSVKEQIKQSETSLVSDMTGVLFSFTMSNLSLRLLKRMEFQHEASARLDAHPCTSCSCTVPPEKQSKPKHCSRLARQVLQQQLSQVTSERED